jgi:hypothetical protein
MPQTEDASVREYVDALLAGKPLPATPQPIHAQMDIKMIKQYRVVCPQCGELPDSPFLGAADGFKARRDHWADHRDGRI